MPAGHILFEVGSVGREFYVILSGECSVYQRGNNDEIEEEAQEPQTVSFPGLSAQSIQGLPPAKTASLLSVGGRQGGLGRADPGDALLAEVAGPEPTSKRPGFAAGPSPDLGSSGPCVRRIAGLAQRKHTRFRAVVEQRGEQFLLRDGGVPMILINGLRRGDSFGEFALISQLSMDVVTSGSFFALQ